jgi:MinD superfamily P-loop ATPase
MKIAILSGKGGTGKTTVAVNLFSFLDDVTLLDCDVEEPNDHLFLSGTTQETIEVEKHYPLVDAEKCTLCGACGEHCHFNAIIPTNKKVLVFQDLCHDCGMCSIVCPQDAISYAPKTIGIINRESIAKQKELLTGTLNVGEVSGVSLIEGLKETPTKSSTTLIDCPPGVSCSTVTALGGADFAIIVAEPTPFGVSDMKMVVELLRNEHIPFGVVINKSGIGNDEIYTYLEEEKITILGEIPFSKKRAHLYSEGKLMLTNDPKLQQILATILTNIHQGVAK